MKRTGFALFSLLLPLLLSCTANTPRTYRETPTVKVVRAYAPAVVNIRTEQMLDLKEDPHWGEYGEQLDQMLKDHFGESYSEGTIKYPSLGSGVIVDRSGLIVTNAHVVQKATSIIVVLSDGIEVKAEVKAVSKEEDLALIRVNLPHAVPGLRFARVKDLMIGETVIAIGNPLGFENSVTVGVLSGKDRAFSNQECEYSCSGLLQTDASINPGNSGGALLNLDGELVGINLAVVQNAQNIGFAVPVDKVQRLMNAISR